MTPASAMYNLLLLLHPINATLDTHMHADTHPQPIRTLSVELSP